MLLPTWDLILIIFALVVISYSCIMGKDRTVKIIIGTYIAILAADGIGSSVFQYFLGNHALFNFFTIHLDPSITIAIKIALFGALIIFFTLRGAFEADVSSNTNSKLLHLLLTFTYSLLSSLLIISALLVYLTGGSFITNLLAGSSALEPTALARSLYQQSVLAKFIINNASLLFALPALTFLVNSFTFEVAENSDYED